MAPNLVFNLLIFKAVWSLNDEAVLDRCDEKEYTPCPDWTTLIEGDEYSKCVKVVLFKKEAWSEADDHCVYEGGELLQIMSEGFQKVLLDKAVPQHINTIYWLNLRPDANGVLKWGSMVEPPPYMHNDVTVDDRKECVILHPNTGEWHAMMCEASLAFICEFEGPRRPALKLILTPPTKLNIYPVGASLGVSCVGEMSPESSLTITLTHGPQTLYFPANHTNVTVYQEYIRGDGSTCSRVVTTTLHLPVSLASKPHQVQLGCVFHPENEKPECRGSQKCNISQSVSFRYMNLPPVLKLRYHHLESIVHLHRDLVSECTACVGIHGNVTWEEFYRGGTWRRVEMDSPEVTYSEEWQMCGKVVKSTFTTEMTSNSYGMTIICTSYRQELPNKDRLNLLSAMSPPLVVESGPIAPDLYVEYHDPGYQVIPGWNLSANCSACVGKSGGDIYWYLLEPDNSSILLDQLVQYDLSTYSIKELGPVDCGVYVMSYLEIRVIAEMEGKRISCSSYLGTYLPGVDLTNSSHPLVLGEFWHHDGFMPPQYIPRTALEIIPVIILLLLIILLLIIIKRCLFQPAAGKRKQRRTQQQARPRGKSRSPIQKWSPKKGMSPFQGRDTCVDTGIAGLILPHSSQQLADMLKIPLPEARRRRKLLVQRMAQVRSDGSPTGPGHKPGVHRRRHHHAHKHRKGGRRGDPWRGRVSKRASKRRRSYRSPSAYHKRETVLHVDSDSTSTVSDITPSPDSDPMDEEEVMGWVPAPRLSLWPPFVALPQQPRAGRTSSVDQKPPPLTPKPSGRRSPRASVTHGYRYSTPSGGMTRPASSGR